MEFRDMFKAVFGGKSSPMTVTRWKMLNDYVPVFSSYDGELYDSDIVRTCIDAIAKNAAKLKARHIRRVDNQISPTSSNIEWLLQVRPNPYMNAYDFLYKVVSQLYSNNNAFIYIQTDGRGVVTGFYPINFSSLEPLEYQGEMYCRFTFLSGFRMTVPYTSLIHLRRHFNRDDIFGEDNRKPFRATLNLMTTVTQGIINAIKSSARLRGFLTFKQSLRPEDLKVQRDKFVEDYLSISNDGGIGATDAKADFTPTEVKPVLTDDKQMAIIRENAYRYFGVNEKIIQATYTEDEWNAFYESVLEPIAIQLSLECTAKIFTDRELGYGNEIVFEANRLQYVSTKTKIQLIKEVGPLGMLTINEGREIFNLAPVEDGDKRLQTLNVVDASKANQYQVGEGNGDGQTGNPDGGTSGAAGGQ